jgi:putative ABC transport system permease protein
MHLLWAENAEPVPHEIIGVVGDVRTVSDGPPVPTVYLPIWTFYQPEIALVMRSRMDPAALEKPISAAIWSANPRIAITQERTLKTIVAASEATRRYETSLGTVFAAFALLLAALGLYGVLSYSVQQRTHEIGIRMALGAQRADILRDVLAHGGRLTLAGVALGVGTALGLTRLIAAMLFGISATDPLTFAAVVAILLAVALLACLIPARRATRVDPMAALRHE